MNNDIEHRVSRLEDKIDLLIALADPERDGFVYHMLEVDATREQVKKTRALVHEYWENIRAGTETRNYHQFEQGIYSIFPDKNGDYHFAEGVVSTHGRNGRYVELYNYMMKSGMNFHPVPDD